MIEPLIEGSSGPEKPTWQKIQGLVIPMITPAIYTDERIAKIDQSGLTNLIEYIVDGVDEYSGAIFILGTLGEFRELTGAKKIELINQTSNTLRGRLPLLVGISADTIGETEELIRTSIQNKTSAVLIPLYGEGEPIDKIKLVGNSGLPFFIYNNPPIHTGIWENEDLPLNLVDYALQNYSTFVGLKESSKDSRRLNIVLARKEIRVFHGSPTMAVKDWGTAVGGVFGFGNVYPRETAQFVRQLIMDPTSQDALRGISNLRNGLGTTQEIKAALYDKGILNSALLFQK